MEPSVGWTFVLLIGFFGWIGSTVGFIFQGITKENRLDKKRALIWGLLIVAFYAMWIAGLYFA